MRKFLCILTVLMCIVAYSDILNAQTVPPYPDKTPYTNALTHFNAWRYETIPQAEKNVDSAFKAAMKIVNDFKNANASIRATLYSALPASIKTNMVSALSSALSISVNAATNMAKATTLAGAASTAFSNHETKLKTFNDYWDGSGTVTQETTQTEMQAEVNTNGVVGVQADSLMEAFHRLEYAAGIYNLQVQKWNKYAPSQTLAELTISDPSKPGFTQLGCFNHCGDRFDTFSDAESSHKETCGTGDNIDLFDTNRPAAEYGAYLQNRKVEQGCGRYYYDCPQKPAGTEHDVQTCTTWVWEKPSGYLNAFQSYRCGRKFRECMFWMTRDHNPYDLNPFEGTHSASGDSSTAETAQNEQTPVDNSPNCEYCTDSCSACTQPTTPAMHPCGIHATSVSGDHSLQASCSLSNNWMRTCTVTNFYACQTHTCVFPTFQCGRRVNGYRVCNESVSDEQEHYVTCPNGHLHWSCKSEHHNHHRLRTCGNLYRSGTRCSKTWRRCRFYPEPISSTGLSSASPRCPTDSNGILRCAE